MKTLIFLLFVVSSAQVGAQDYRERRAVNDLRRAIARDVQQTMAATVFQSDRRKYYRWRSSSVAPYGALGKLPVTQPKLK